MTETEVLAYVIASAAAQGLQLSEARTRGVASHLTHAAHLAQLLEAVPLAPHDELADIYRILPVQPPSTTTPAP